MDNQEVSAKAHEWFLLAESLEWKSFDPFDLLLSPYFKDIQKVLPLAARLCVQVGKRSGSAIRHLCKVSPHEEAKTLSDYLEAAVLLSECGEDWANAYLPVLAGRLMAKSIVTPQRIAWGLEFPYATRFVNVKARTPNIYQTANAIQALLRLYSLTRSEEYLRYAIQGADFIMGDLGVFTKDGLLWFRYWSNSDAPIVNIQATTAGIFSALGNLTREKRFLEASESAVNTVMSVQNPDGSWYYSMDGKANFIDGFHTGFILQGLAEYIVHSSNENYSRVNEVLQKGFDFFKRHLVDVSDMPLDFADGKVSLDGQNFAQCVQTFAVCGRQSSADIEVGMNVWRELVKIPSLNRNRGHELRWTYGPSVLATAHLNRAIAVRMSGFK